MQYEINQNYLMQTLIDLVGINSINPNFVPDSPGEGDIAQYLADKMRVLGLQVELQELEPNRINTVGIWKGRGGGKSLMLNGHTDTMGVDGMARPFAGEIRDGRMVGRGAFDMKASLAATLTAVKSLIEADVQLAGDVVLAMVIDEEHGSIGTEDVVKRYPVDGAIVTEPTGLRLCLAHRGFQWIEVEVFGRAAHGSRYQDGIDANRLMGHFLVALDDFAEALLAREGHHLLGPPSIHAPIVKGGSAASVYAAHCYAGLERRTLPGETVEQVVAEIQAIVDKLTQTVPNFRAEVRAGFGRGAYEVDVDAEIVDVVRGAAERILGASPDEYGELWWMDSALLGEAGIETVIMGPIGAGAHADEEWVDLESVVEFTHILIEAITEYCG